MRNNNSNQHDSSARGCEMVLVIAPLQPTNLHPMSTTEDSVQSAMATSHVHTPKHHKPTPPQSLGLGTQKNNRNSVEKERWASLTKRSNFSPRNMDWIGDKMFLWGFISEKSLVKIHPCFLQIQLFCLSKWGCIVPTELSLQNPKYSPHIKSITAGNIHRT